MTVLAALYPETIRGADLFGLDRPLARTLERLDREALVRHRHTLSRFGRWVGEVAEPEATYTDRYAPPVLEAYDRGGRLLNRIVHNAQWERASREAYAQGIVGLNYTAPRAPFLVTFAMGYLLSQANVSLHCPVTMTGALAYVLDRFAPEPLKRRYLNALTRMDGEPLTGGTWATELHGGSDVGATTTRAVGQGDGLRLYGLKWFTSNANGGLALTTARPEGAPAGSKGLGVYLVPTHLADGSPNPMRIRRLKDKLGTKGVPTGEIDLNGTHAFELAPPPRGFRLMMEALGFSRIHNAMGAAGVVRRALMEATAFALRRSAFGQTISDYPMVQDELLHLLVAHEASLALAFEAASAFDRAHQEKADPEAETPARVWLRLTTALAKYQTAEDAVAAARRALEVIGGNAYTSDYPLARILRDAQVLTVWEGPANIQALELVRLLGDRFAGGDLFRARVGAVLARAPDGLARAVAALRRGLEAAEGALAFMAGDPDAQTRHARRLLSFLADLLAATLLLEQASAEVEAGDYRLALVLELLIEERLEAPARRAILPGRGWTSHHFQALMGHAPVSTPPEFLRGH